MTKAIKSVDVPMVSEDHEIEVGLKETIFIALGTAVLTVVTATSIHAFRERSRRKTYKSMADSVGTVISKFMEVEVSAGNSNARQIPARTARPSQKKRKASK